MFEINFNCIKIIAFTMNPLDYCKNLYGMYILNYSTG